MTKLLVVDNETEICGALRELFEGCSIEFESDCDRGLLRVQTEAYDVLIFDVMLDGGIEMLKCVRELSPIPVLILSAKADWADRVSGLQAGADDYLAKPFYPEELLARVHAILRRTRAALDPAPGAIQIGELKLMPASREAYFQQKRLDLTTMEIEILECLMRSFGQVVSRDLLSQRLYNRLSAPFERNIDTHVSRIRRKMGDGSGMILSVRGTGYQIRHRPSASAAVTQDAPDTLRFRQKA